MTDTRQTGKDLIIYFKNYFSSHIILTWDLAQKNYSFLKIKTSKVVLQALLFLFSTGFEAQGSN